MNSYDSTFFDYVNSCSVRSAQYLLPVLLKRLSVESVLDVGCGQGAWLSGWKELGITDITGVDGDYVDRSRLLCPVDSFASYNLSESFDLGRRYDLVQSLEVAEHLPRSSAASFVASLVRHGDMILFSAAPKGQGGDNHVNEQSYDYWRAHFSDHDYIPIDYLRPLVISDERIAPWYRYNTLLYVSPDRFSLLPIEVRDCRVPDENEIRDLSPPLYQLRKLIVRCLPVSVMTRIAKWKEHKVVRATKSQFF